MTSHTTAPQVRADHTTTGNVTLDRLLDDSTPETLAAALCCLRLPWLDNAMGDRLQRTLEQRVKPFREGQWPDDLDALAEIAPTVHWLTVLDRCEALPEGKAVTLDTGGERVHQSDAPFVGALRSNVECFFMRSFVAQRFYIMLRNEYGASVREDYLYDRDTMTPCLSVSHPTAYEACCAITKRYGLKNGQVAKAVQELEDAGLLEIVC